jgi:hypothetical protein
LLNITMPTLDFLDRNVLWIAPPLMCVAALLLRLFICSEVRLVKEAKILSVPLVEQQEVEFQEAGRAVLCIEGPQLSRRFAGFSYALSTADGVPVEGRAAFFRARTTRFSWARLELRVYEISHPGRYVLLVQGLRAAQPGDANHRLVFTRPHLAPTLGYVIGMILSFGLFMVCLVFFLLRLMGEDVRLT